MTKNIIWDLEGVLIDGINHPLLNPHATKVLEMSAKDFDNKYLWTYNSIHQAFNCINKKGLANYFNYLIGYDILKEEKLKAYTVICRLDNGRLVEQKYTELENKKDISLLGGSLADYVIIDDDMKGIVVQKERLVKVVSFGAFDEATFRPLDCNLTEAYQKALKMF